MSLKKVVVKKDNMSKAMAVAIAKHALAEGEHINTSELSALFGKYADASPTALVQIASNNYTPSLYIAMKLSEFLQEEVENLFEVSEQD